MGTISKNVKCISARRFGTNVTTDWYMGLGIMMVLGVYIGVTEGAAVMSVDLGSEWMKVGVVSAGVPMEIALNKESKRKSPAILSFRNGIRAFGEDAMATGMRDPSSAFGYLLDLLGKTIDNPIVDIYRMRFPYYQIVADPERNTVVFKTSANELYTVEELVAQILLKAKEFAEDSTHQSISECVLTVPGYFGQAERNALLTAARLANLKVLQLINDYTAVALNYGVFNRAEINETASYYIFYDMGAYKTSVAVVSYQLIKDKQTKEINPIIHVLGVGYDRALGASEIQMRLRDYLAKEFNAMKKTTSDVTSNPRSLAKLFKEAGRVKNVLSANTDHYAQIENLIDDQDFKLQVTRQQLEELCADLWPRILQPLEDALKSSGLTINEITQVILFGGGTRVPKVQETLRKAINSDLGKSLNADEAAAMGAVYKAADLATGFKVKKFIIKDAVLFPIHITFERDIAGNASKHVKRVLFGQMNPYPQKKVITFNKHSNNFKFFVHYADLDHLSDREIEFLGSLNISVIELHNIKDVLEKSHQTLSESKGIKAYFNLDDSGIFSCTGVEFIYEKEVDGEDESTTLTKLGNTISKLFGTETKKDDNNEIDNGKNNPINKSNDSTNANITENSAQPQNDTKSVKGIEKNDTVKIVTVKEPIEHTISLQFTSPLSEKSFEVSLKKLNEINSAERERNRLESAFNNLESHVIEIQQKLEEEEYAKCVKQEEKIKILDECSTITEWLYENTENTNAEVYEKRLRDLKKLTSGFLIRHWEHQERPDALKALDEMIDGASKFLATAKNLTKEHNPEKDVFTTVEIDLLSKIINETKDWKEAEIAAQNKLKHNDDVRVTVKDITSKMSTIDREVKYLVNKFKIWKPKAKATSKSGEKSKSTDNSDTLERESGKLEDNESIQDDEHHTKEEPTTNAEDTTTPHSEL